jgi:hypothetical protein
LSNIHLTSTQSDYISAKTVHEDRWEAGSSFAFVTPILDPEPWLPDKHSLVGTGRQAIIAAFLQGQKEGL